MMNRVEFDILNKVSTVLMDLNKRISHLDEDSLAKYFNKTLISEIQQSLCKVEHAVEDTSVVQRAVAKAKWVPEEVMRDGVSRFTGDEVLVPDDFEPKIYVYTRDTNVTILDRRKLEKYTEDMIPSLLIPYIPKNILVAKSITVLDFINNRTWLVQNKGEWTLPDTYIIMTYGTDIDAIDKVGRDIFITSSLLPKGGRKILENYKRTSGV